MSDRYAALVATPVGTALARRLGLPCPSPLRRYVVGQPLLGGPALLGAAGGGPLLPTVAEVLRDAGAEVRGPGDDAVVGDAGEGRLGSVLLDASGARDVADLEQARALLAPAIRRLAPSGRLLVLGSPPEAAPHPAAAATQRALEGVVRSVAKELRGGATANLLYVGEGAAGALGSPLRYFLSARSAYVSGQALRVGPPAVPPLDDDGGDEAPGGGGRPLDGRVAVVTGAARGIGAAIADVLARDGAAVVCVDVPAAGEALAGVANRVDGSALQLDITRGDVAQRLVRHLTERHGGADVVVHNAGITRDRLLANLDADRWGSVLAVNLDAQLRINAALLEGDVLRDHGRVVCVSSTSGIAGNRGQANYAASKAGVIGMVQALAPALAARGGTVNAVAPGFIETDMTAKIPFGMREIGRRVNSLAQGGLPVDVAETVAWLAAPDSGGVNGQVVRVCGQSVLGA